MWTLWLVSKVLHRLSVRNQSTMHSSASPRISGMKHKYTTMRKRRTGVEGWGYRAATFFPCQFAQHVALLLILPLKHAGTHIETISYENISPSSNVQGPQQQQNSPSGNEIRGEVWTLPASTERPPWNPPNVQYWLQFNCKCSSTGWHREKNWMPTEGKTCLKKG